MSLFDKWNLADNEQDKLTEITQTFLVHYEVYTEQRGSSVSWNDSTKELFNNNRFIFGQLVLQLFTLFKIRATHLPLTEFMEFPTVEDLIGYLYTHARI